jgi:hypothetical protein
MTEMTHAQYIGPPPYRTLIVKYALITMYGLTSCIVGVVTLDVAAGAVWAVLWPILVTVLAFLALLGVVHSWRTGRERFELVTTLLLIAMLVGYTVAILLRTWEDGEVSRLPVAWLPIILSVYPGRRLIQIALTPRTKQ